MEIYQAAYVAIAVFTVPGFVVAWISGLKLPWAVGVSIPASFGIYGLAGWYYGTTSYAFDLNSVGVMWGFLTALALLWRLCFWRGRVIQARRRERKARFEEQWRLAQDELDDDLQEGDLPDGPERVANAGFAKTEVMHAVDMDEVDDELVDEPADFSDDPDAEELAEEPKPPRFPRLHRWWNGQWRVGSVLDPVWILPAAGILTGCYMLIARGLKLLDSAKGGMENIFQGWDVHWHASVIQFIGDTGVASSTRMGELQNLETHDTMFYPAAWHDGVWVFKEIADISPIAAINISSIVLPGLLLPASVGLIAWRLVGKRGLTAQIAAGLAGLIVVPLPVLMWIGNYVGAWPYLAAIAMSGIVLGIFMSVPAVPSRAFATALAFGGMVQTHPSAATVVVMSLACWWLLWLLWAPARKPRGWKQHIGYRFSDVLILAATGAVGTLLLLPQILSGAGQTEEVKAFTAQEDISRTDSWWVSIKMLTRHAEDFGTNWPLLWTAAVGGVLLILWRRNLWGPAFYALSIWICANSLVPFGGGWADILGSVGALHYNTGHRLVMPAAMFCAAAAGVGLAAVGRLVLLGPIQRWKPLRIGSNLLSIIAGIVGACVLVSYIPSMMDKSSDWSILSPRDDRMVDKADRAGFDWLAKQPHAYDGAIMFNPAEGPGWMYAYNGLPGMFRHYSWPSAKAGTDTSLVYHFPNFVGQGNYNDPDYLNDIDLATRNLGVNYFFVSPPNFWAFQEPHPNMEFGLWDAPGLTPIYKNKQVIIFAVNAQFTDAELEQMRAPGNSPEPLPPLRTKGEAGATELMSEWNEPYFHRSWKLPHRNDPPTIPPKDGTGEDTQVTDPLVPVEIN